MSSCVPCLCWVPKGVAKEVPDKVELSKAEVQELLHQAQDQLEELGIDEQAASVDSGDDKTPAGGGAAVSGGTEQGIEEIYDLDNYDDDQGEAVSGAGMGNSMAGLAYFASNEEDPYITLKNTVPQDDDKDDYKILPSDNLLVIGRAEEEFSSLEVHVYSEGEEHVYSHHEVLLTAFPLALEWMDFDPEQPDKKGNYIAVGTMSPVIEVWDLDVVDGLEPMLVLGDPAHLAAAQMLRDKVAKSKSKDKKNTSPPAAEPVDGHSDAVLGISWNKLARNVVASASADCTVRVWDMSWPRCVLTLKHKNKVQCVQWHPYSPELLATGDFSKRVSVYNCKGSEKPFQSWKVNGEVERLVWNHLEPDKLLATTDQSMVWCFSKDSGTVIFQIHAHNGPITGLCLSPQVPGLLVTASGDDTVKFWDILDDKPAFLFNRDMHMGSVHCAQFCVDTPYILAVGGEKNGFHIINTEKLLPVTQRFKKRGYVVPTATTGTEGIPGTGPSQDEVPTDQSNQEVGGASAMDVTESPEPKVKSKGFPTKPASGKSTSSKKKTKIKQKRKH